jgi:hypothetical protein
MNDPKTEAERAAEEYSDEHGETYDTYGAQSDFKKLREAYLTGYKQGRAAGRAELLAQIETYGDIRGDVSKRVTGITIQKLKALAAGEIKS